jgi:DDE family transposase
MAKVTGFMKRKFGAFEFDLLMVAGQMSMVHPFLSGMVKAVRAKISRVALHLRFTAQASKFLLACLKMVLEYSVRPDGIMPSALDAFKRVHIFDSLNWDINPGLKHVLSGSGGGALDSNSKLQAGYEYKSGSLGFFVVTEGVKPDQVYSNRLVDFVEKDDQMLTDLGYFKLSVFQKLTAKGAYFLSKLLIGMTLRNAGTSGKIDLDATLPRNIT